jgi:hypothetical protein
MGQQCSRLCCRVCRTPTTITNRIEKIYTDSPTEPSETYYKNRTNKIYEILKDQRSKIPECVKLLESKAKLESNNNLNTEKNIKITLYILRQLSIHLKEFLPLTHHYLQDLICEKYFNDIKDLVYETLILITDNCPDEDIIGLEDIIKQLLKYLKDPSNVSKKDIKLLERLVVPLKGRIVGNSIIDWKKLAELVLDRIEGNEDTEEDFKLLGSLSKVLLSANSIGDLFLEHLAEYLFNKNLPGDKSSLVFQAIISQNRSYFNENGSDAIRVLCSYIKSHKSYDNTLNTLILVIQNSKNISIINYSSLFESIIIDIISHSHTIGTEILDLLMSKIDEKSFFIFSRNILSYSSKKTQAIFSLCKKKINAEISSKKCSVVFLKLLLELVYDTINLIKAEYNKYLLKVSCM